MITKKIVNDRRNYATYGRREKITNLNRIVQGKIIETKQLRMGKYVKKRKLKGKYDASCLIQRS